ncbi:MAG TPA: hypothetical protein VHM72_05500, partial [Solirubrobacteraceae bacterium]|nr:hypothetical protein [Solirubrobacteraceae bacterium]
MSRMARAVALAAVGLAIAAAPAAGSAQRRVLLVLIPVRNAGGSLERFRSYEQLESVALMTASIGSYNEEQTLLDITQGSRVPRLDYSPQAPPQFSVTRGGEVREWAVIARRARSADASIEPGLLASRVPGGAAYARAGAAASVDAVLAAGRRGRLAAISLGSRRSLLGRVQRLLARHGLVVVDLAGDALGFAELHAMLVARRRGELVLVLERPPQSAARAARTPLLLALGAAGLATTPGALTTPTTRIDGLVSASDLAPTIIRWLDRHGPSELTGQAINPGAPRSV